MSKVWAVAVTNLYRFLRDRSNIFFVFIFPIGLVFILGLSFGGGEVARFGLVASDDPLSTRLERALEGQQSFEVVRVAEESALRDKVERGVYMAGLIVPGNLSEHLAAGGSVQLEFLTTAGGAGAQLQLPVLTAVGEVSERVRAAGSVAARVGLGFDEALERVDELAEETATVTVSREWLGADLFGDDMEAFDLSAASQLVLFMFLTGLAASGALIESRKLGVSRRMLSTPTTVLTIVIGEVLGRFAVALFQGAYIMVATWLLFGVSWGDPFGALALLAVFAAVAAGAGMLMGATFDNDQQAGAAAVIAGLGLAALGGAMVPLELFGPTMESIARFTPHAWAVDGFGELLRNGGTLVDLLPQISVLAGYAAALVLLGAVQLRSVLTKGAS